MSSSSKISVRSFNNAKKEMPKHFLKCDLVKTTPFDKEPEKKGSFLGFRWFKKKLFFFVFFV
ncbi:hypothetical protein [Enterococcus faecalis]|uniref:hypothetical protein n=1 Tax=Enterococcus faecalis TaxID=1351 RepID=UPI0021AF07DA|nr:hypothetical protein [Enterococcus faecalis]